MAEPDFPLNIDRRHLLATGAAVATAAIALRADRVDAALADTVQLPALTPEVPPLNVCTATARRFLEIARRNEIRREGYLPLLSIPKELRRMKKQEELEEFERFEAVYGKAVRDEVLKPRREAEGNPNWRPSWMEGTVAVGSPTLLGSASRIPKLQAAALDTRGHASERRDAQPRLADAAGAALTSGLMRW